MTESKSIGELNYEQFADRYARMVETKPHNAHYERPATLSLLPDVRGLHVLDAGCGPGVYTAWLLDHGASVVAFDVTPHFVEYTRRRVNGCSDVTVLRADLSQPLAFAAESSFDLVLCALVLDYIEDWRPVFAEFYRIIRPGGALVFSCGHPFGDYLLIKHRGLTPGNYFAIESYEMAWTGFGNPKPLVKSFRRPLGEVINPLLRAGFTLDVLLEPQPTDAFKEYAPETYERLKKQPGFLCVRALKP